MTKRFERLTRPAIRQLARGESINEHGITAERLSSGDVRYRINIMVDGQRIHRVIGTESTGVTREQAERAIEAFRTKAREGRLDLPNGRKVHLSFTEAAKLYLERIEPDARHGRNLVAKRRHVNNRLVPYFRQHRPDRLTEFTIASYAKARKGEGASPATVNRELATLSHMLGRLVAWKIVRERPRVTKSVEQTKAITTLSPAQQSALMQAAIADQDQATWLFVAIAMWTGMRHSEILRIQWQDVDTDKRRINVGRAKAGARVQPIPPSLADTLAREIEQRGTATGYLFPSTRADGKLPHRKQMSKQFARAVTRAGLDPSKVTPHVLRHTAITALVQAGVDLPTVQKISGHKTLAMVLRYTHVADAHVSESVARLDEAFSAALTPELHTPTEAAKIRAA